MELTIKDLARKLNISEKAVRNRLYRRRIKPLRLEESITRWGLSYNRGYYPDDTLEKIR